MLPCISTLCSQGIDGVVKNAETHKVIFIFVKGAPLCCRVLLHLFAISRSFRLVYSLERKSIKQRDLQDCNQLNVLLIFTVPHAFLELGPNKQRFYASQDPQRRHVSPLHVLSKHLRLKM